MRKVITPLSFVVIGLATLPAPGGASAAGVHPMGTPACASTHLLGVSLDSETDGWAVGYHFEPPANQALALRWDGESWTRVNLPVLGAESYLYAVTALGPRHAVAVGIYRVGGQFRTAILSWNGHAWKQQPSPSPDARSNALYGVSMLSADDAWAVGAYGVSEAKPLALHWDGGSWATVTTPNPTTFDYLQSVDGASSDDVWAVGATREGTLALHWDGSSWLQVDSFDGPNLDTFFGVSAISSDDIWAVGDDGLNRPLTEHWDGSAWSLVRTPGQSQRSNTLNGVDAAAGDDVWAVGSYQRGRIDFALTVHWDGAKWTNVPVAGKWRTLGGVSALSNDDAWAVGSRGPNHCLIERWDGSAWSRWIQ